MFPSSCVLLVKDARGELTAPIPAGVKAQNKPAERVPLLGDEQGPCATVSASLPRGFGWVLGLRRCSGVAPCTPPPGLLPQPFGGKAEQRPRPWEALALGPLSAPPGEDGSAAPAPDLGHVPILGQMGRH